ncbi:uncharacterized protein LOC129602497 [Paramacrobiotus metropolitanus]|uniref:uncharacterized protein LOC129602497 n=1 Tax=Paramacrobiotus metropolitanus TaxID=2943436 RepID=UPI002445656D|nr:uncharacterized protein LOC129602497 [Paramacrobiotus metropolitanus]
MDRKIPEPVPAAGTLSVRRQSPVRRYQDQPLRQRAAPAPVSVERGESFLRPAPVAKNAGFRSSGNFSDATAASFAYMDQPAPPVYAFPDKLQKKQNLRHRSMSEHNLNQPPLDSQSTFQYEDPHPVKPSKSVESLTESVHKEKYHGPLIVTNRPYKTSTERVTKTNLIPYGKQDGFQRPVRNTARVRSPRSSIYDKVGSGHYSSTPVLASTNKPAGMYSRNAPPLKPPRSYGVDWTAPSTDRDSDLQSSVEERIRLPAERPLERSRAEIDLRAATDRSDLYSEPLSTTADEAVHRAQSPIHERFHGHVIQGKSEVEKLVPEVKRTGSTVQSVDMAARTRTRMAANDYANRRYQSAAAGVNQIPVEKPRRMIPRESRPIERDSAKHYTSSYRMEMQNPPPGPSGGVVAERSRFFSDLPGMRKEYAVRR